MSITRKITTTVLVLGLTAGIPAHSHPAQTRATYSPTAQTTGSELAVSFPEDTPVTLNVGPSGTVLVSVSAYAHGLADLTVAIDGQLPRRASNHLVFDIEGFGQIAGSGVLHASPGDHRFALRYFPGSSLPATYQNRELTVSAL